MHCRHTYQKCNTSGEEIALTIKQGAGEGQEKKQFAFLLSQQKGK